MQPPDAAPPPAQPGGLPDWMLAEEPVTGTGRGRTCAFCGLEAPPDSAFCPNDGRSLTAALRPAADAPLSVVFTDIEDSVWLTVRFGDATWTEIVDEHNAVVREALQRHSGFEVKVTGDGFLIVFPDPIHAVRAAVGIQRRVTARAEQHRNWPVRVRIGIHRGEVVVRPGGDVLGHTVNMAERIMKKAAGGEIWVSDSVYAHVEAAIPSEDWLDRGLRRLRGVPQRQHLYELDWARLNGASASPPTPPAPDTPADPGAEA